MRITRVIIVGFSKMEELDAAMRVFMEENDCWVFAVVTSNRESLAGQWAEKNGAPIELGKPEEADFLVFKMSDELSIAQRNILSRFKNLGKHGRVIR